MKEVKTMFTNRSSRKRLIICALMVLGLLIPVFAMAANSVETLLILDGEAAGDRFGSWIAPAGDVNGDGFKDFLVGAYLNDAGGTDAGRVYLYMGGPTVDGIPDLVFTGEEPEDYLCPVAQAGDVNDDGFDDFLLGARGKYGVSPGHAYLYFGGSTPDATPDLIFEGEYPGDVFGAYLAGVGDINADGHDDFIITACWWPRKGYHGRSYVYFGGPGLDNIADMVINGPAGGEFGCGMAPGGDLNGDGFSDFVIGAYKSDLGGFDSGGAWLYYGGPGLDGTADLVFAGEGPIEYFGGQIDLAGDVNGDGFEDLIIGAKNFPQQQGIGRAYLYLGGPGIDNSADLVLTGETVGDRYGSVAGIGDVNRDGFSDFIVGANGNDSAAPDAGKAYVYFGGPTPDTAPDIILAGEAAGDNFGTWVTSVGDVNGDGCPEFAVGAYGSDAAGVDAGRVYVFSVPAVITFDIKPRSCPNPFNMKWMENKDKGSDNDHAMHKKGGVMPAALVGSEDFDVTDIDLSTLHLEGITPLRTAFEDVTRPVTDGGECACTTDGPDGILDLTMKFSRQEVAGILGEVKHGDVVKLTITATMNDGTPIEASDCITILSKHPEPKIATDIDEVKLYPAIPNPFNPTTTIRFDLPRAVHVRLQVYNVKGELVSTIMDRHMTEGRKEATWNAQDDRGRTVASGIYFYRLVAGDFMQTKKMVLLQ
ncbi:MAG: FG-GAP repeat protein [bacterium]|nr:MAG: FG-GAP repeat protein [bacterium]